MLNQSQDFTVCFSSLLLNVVVSALKTSIMWFLVFSLNKWLTHVCFLMFTFSSQLSVVLQYTVHKARPGWDVSQRQCLACMHKALGSMTSTTNKTVPGSDNSLPFLVVLSVDCTQTILLLVSPWFIYIAVILRLLGLRPEDLRCPHLLSGTQWSGLSLCGRCSLSTQDWASRLAQGVF